MIITVMDSEGLASYSLPSKVMGQYDLYDPSGYARRIAQIEAIDGEWSLKVNGKFNISDEQDAQLKRVQLKPNSVHIITDGESNRYYLFSEPITADRQTFTKYVVEDGFEISIGSDSTNALSYNNEYVAPFHAVLSKSSSGWVISNNGDSYGTYVNSERVERKRLSFGDCVFISGLKIIIGGDFIAINNPDGKVSVSQELSRYVAEQVSETKEDSEYEIKKPDYFYRSPRFKRDIKTAVFKIDQPPQSPVSEEMPWPLVLGSSMTMGMMSVVMLWNAITTRNIPSIVMGASMLLGTLLMPMITKRYEKSQKRKKEKLRQEKYKEYLEGIKQRIAEESELQTQILNENHITVAECERRIISVDRRLWDRSADHNDFLRLRLGVGVCDLDANFTASERTFQLTEDNLEEQMYELCEAPKILENIPITYSLKDDFISGVIGEPNQVVDIAKGLIVQLASLYSYDEVKMVFLYDDSIAEEMEFVKWLPHTWNDDYSFRFIATNTSELKEVSAYLERVIDARRDLNENEMENESPYYVIFSMSKTLSSKAEMIKQVLAKKENMRISLFFADDELKNLPRECSIIISVDDSDGRLFDRKDISGDAISFTPDIRPSTDTMQLSRMLSNIKLDTAGASSKFPSMITFLEMFGVGKIEHLNALARWKDNDPTKTLETPVGVDAQGDLFKLDLHEKFHGPHGLVAGMTGSGKSEFIITYILSLAVNYHPDEVAFILIDYKGGGMAKSFEKLPHTAGIITNLDGAAIKRSLISIESELKRRQAIFAQASKKVSMSNIDIYKYQKLYREGIVDEPLQHLFIISDEFAELKTQQPEFMAQLVSAARIGRSLGVHLILATQKPSGVVDDQIWSNSKFRICLKVQERSDSMDMIKRPDAAELKDTGRFYLQVGYNELFEMGQSAWAGASYSPSDTVVTQRDDSIVVIDRNGHPIKQLRPGRKSSGIANAKKQLDEITSYLCSVADGEGIKVKPLWLEPIPAVITVDALREKYSGDRETEYVINPVIGEYDDPARQRQCLLRLPISEEGNTVVYGAAVSGKTTFVTTMLYSLITEHTPDEVNLYVLDFGSETLKAFASAPHVGGVMLSYEKERIVNLFKMLIKETERRKKLFSDYGGDYSSYMNQSGNKLPSIIVTIHNFTAFSETYEELEEAVALLSREGTKYGIYFVLTALGANAVRFRLLQNFRQLIALQLNDTSDYSMVVGKTEGLYPSDYKGRGLIKTDGIYEFQTAYVTDEDNSFSYIKQVCAKLRSDWTGDCAKNIPVLPDVVDVKFISEYLKGDSASTLTLPIGVEKNSMEVLSYPFAGNYITEVLSTSTEYKSFVSGLCRMIAENVDVPMMVIDPTGELEMAQTDTKKLYSKNENCQSAVDELFQIVLTRNNTYKEALERGETPQKFAQLLVVMNSMSLLREALSDEGLEKLRLILEKGRKEYGISIVFADNVKSVSSYSYEKWFPTHLTQTDGIWVGGGIAEQYQLKLSRITPDMRAESDDGFGVVLSGGKGTIVKLLQDGSQEVEYE